MAIRTGPSDYSRWLVTSKRQGGALPSNYKVKDGAVWCGGEMFITPEEEDVYKLLGLPWVTPELRCPPTRQPAY